MGPPPAGARAVSPAALRSGAAPGLPASRSPSPLPPVRFSQPPPHGGPLPTAQVPHRNLGLWPGRGRGRSSRLEGRTPVGARAWVPRHEEPGGAGALGPRDSLPPTQGPSRLGRVLSPARELVPHSRGPRPGPARAAAPALPEPGLSGSPREACFSNFSLSPSSPTYGALPLGPAPRGPRRGRLDTASPPSFGRTGDGRGGRDSGTPGARAGKDGGVGKGGLQPALRTLPRSGPLPPPRSPHAMKNHCLVCKGRVFIGDVGPGSSSPITYPPPPRPPQLLGALVWSRWG